MTWSSLDMGQREWSGVKANNKELCGLQWGQLSQDQHIYNKRAFINLCRRTPHIPPVNIQGLDIKQVGDSGEDANYIEAWNRSSSK